MKRAIDKAVVVVAGLAAAHWYFGDRRGFTMEPETVGLGRSISGNDLLSNYEPAVVPRFNRIYRHAGGQKKARRMCGP